MTSDLKQIGAIGAAIYVVSVIAGYNLPVPHSYESAYKFFFGPIGAFIGYGLSAFVVQRAKNLCLLTLTLIATFAVVGAAVLGLLYINFYWASSSPSFGERIFHAILYTLGFAFLFFSARWAGLLLQSGKKEQ